MIINYGIGFFGREWPVIIAIYLMKWTICWDPEFPYTNTLLVSDLNDPYKVIILLLSGNQQVTNRRKILVGTSETTRPLSSLNSSDWNEWLAGLIDGDGSLLVSKSGYTSCEITMGLEDEQALMSIKQKLGGSVKLRSGVKALRYRIHNREGMINIINIINGNIRHTSRVKQLDAVCSALNIPIIYAGDLNRNNGWFAGFMDADGTITFSIKNNYPQLTIAATNKLLIDISYFKEVFGGNIYYDKSKNGYYKWCIQKRSDILYFKQYLKEYPVRSHKKMRYYMIDNYYELIDLKAYSASPDSPSGKAWANFTHKWKNRG